MACNYDIGYSNCYPVTYDFYPTNQFPYAYLTQCGSQFYNNCNYNAYHNLLRKLENREVAMEYWTRQLAYFRNLLKNFSAEIESPEQLKKLLESCNCNAAKKKYFENCRTFCNKDKNKKVNFGKCCCKNCFEELLLQLCNDLTIPRPSCNKCNCSVCRSRCQTPCDTKRPCTPQNPPSYYIPCQTGYPVSSYYYCYYPPQQQQQQQPAYPMPPCNYPNYCQQMPQQCNSNNTCCHSNSDVCNKCKFKYILNQLNYILLSTEQEKCEPCNCTSLYKKSCCSIEEIKEETIKKKRECDNENIRKSVGSTSNINNKTARTLSCQSTSSSDGEQVKKHSISKRNSNRKCRKYISESSKSHNIYSENETFDDASNISEEYKNCGICDKKLASIMLGEEYTSPSGTFEVLIQDQANKSIKKPNKNNSNLVFQVGYTTYTKPKCEI